MHKPHVKSGNWLVSLGKKHAWWIVSIAGFGVTSASYWISGVNATQVSVIELRTVIPEIRQQMATTNEHLEKLDERTLEMNARLANIEGRFKK